MRKLTLLLITLFPLVLMAQDAIILKDGSQFNCKIIKESKQEIVFQKDSITKRVPAYLVEAIRYNSTLIENVVIDTSNVSKQNQIITDPNVLEIVLSDSIVNKNLYMAGQHKLNALNLGLLNASVVLTGSLLTFITATPEIAYVTATAAGIISIVIIVQEYKSALSLRKAGTVNSK